MGIYRSLNKQQDLQDEIVKFADFSIEEIPSTLSLGINVNILKVKAENILLYPNSSSKEMEFKNANPDNYDIIEMYDYAVRKIPIEKRLQNDKLDVSGFSKGLYFIVFKKDTVTAKILKCFVK